MGEQTITWRLLLLAAAVLLFLFASIGGWWVAAPGDWPWRLRIIALGLFCWALSTLRIM